MDENKNQFHDQTNQEQPLQKDAVPKDTKEEIGINENANAPCNKESSSCSDDEQNGNQKQHQPPIGPYGYGQHPRQYPNTPPAQHWGHVPPNTNPSQNPYGTNGQPYWNQNPNGAPPPNWGNGGWQNGGGFQQPPNWPPPDNKMNLGVKIFLIVLAVLSACCIIGFGVFGAFVVTYQKEHSDYSGNGASSGTSSQSAANSNQNLAAVPDQTDPNFEGITISPATGDILTPEQVYKKVSESMVSVLAPNNSNTSSSQIVSQGSGVIATSNGYIITNAHVINYTKTADIVVITNDQKQYNGIVVGFDKDADLAVIKIDAQDLPAATFGDANALSVGESVIAIGNPGGVRYSGSMTMGVISAVNRTVENFSNTGVTYMQTDTAINPGNSGGGLINMRGQVVGITTIKVVSSGYEGMGFSIPVSQVKTIIDTLIKQGDIPAVGKLGIVGGTQYLPVSGQTYSVASGVLVNSIDSDSPLIDTDLEKGDRIIGFNGATITTIEDIYTHLKDYRVGQEVTLTIRRTTDDKDSTFEIKTKIMQRESKSSSDS